LRWLSVVEVRAERASKPRRPIADLTEAEARRRLPLKWGVPDDVIPAWVAEMDYAVDEVVLEAVQRMLADGITGYPPEWDPSRPRRTPRGRRATSGARPTRVPSSRWST
jgi:hypothetical protein